ncbi:ABC transporter substrate-binding protein [Mesorhizobium sp. L-8-3]|uniref:ABC transporter substrate-binding protein n=1 Tax=Mesorhizobium sp. L-8-3 TaxID=2744522 RepID=UPI001928BA0D|nr:ABC transporter substrate-binding protein [Mesorhizobium sp. L-8-3]BCH25526.1 amino acid-binding protein [Mesorhizobium sp. L-8-3]
MPPRSFILAFATAVCLTGAAAADEPRIGVAVPLSGPSALLGKQLRDGAHAAAAGQAALTDVDDGCTAEGGAAAAHQFVAAGVEIVVGFVCTEAIEAALPILKDAAISVVTPGVRTDSLTDRRKKTGWPVYRLAPRADAERSAVGTLLTRLWSDALFAIVDDGTIYGRELAEGFRGAAEQSGLKPVFVDTFRPQLDNQIGLVGRIRKAGATHLFVGGDRDDIAVIERDAQALGVPLVIAGGEALRSAPGEVPLRAGTLMVGLPEWAETADRQATEALAKQGVIAEGYALPGYAAMQVAIAAAVSGDAAAALDIEEFRTAIGLVRFDDKGDLSTNPYRLFHFDGARFVAATDGG